MKKRWIGLAATIVLLLSACGNEGTDTTGSEDDNGESDGNNASGEQVEIRFSWWGDTDRNEMYDEIVSRFEDENPDIRVMREFGGWNDYWTRLTTQVGGGNAPDVMSMHQFYVSDYANRGALLGLDGLVEDGVIDQSLFDEAVTDSGRIGDELYMIAKGVTMSGFVYVPALFEEYGIEMPSEDWTYDDLDRIGREFSEASGGEIAGVSDYSGGQLEPNFGYFVRQNGYDLFTDEGNLGFPVEVVGDWWEMWHERREEGGVPDASLVSEVANATLEENLFATGRVAMFQIPANQLHLYQGLYEEDVEIISFPSLPGGEPGEFIEGAYLSIAESSDHPEEAARFIDFFVNTQESLELFLVEQGAPGNSEMSEFVQELLDETNSRAIDFVNQQVSEARQAPFAPEGIAELENVFSELAEAVAFGRTEAREAADSFMQRAEELGFVE